MLHNLRTYARLAIAAGLLIASIVVFAPTPALAAEPNAVLAANAADIDIIGIIVALFRLIGEILRTVVTIVDAII